MLAVFNYFQATGKCLIVALNTHFSQGTTQGNKNSHAGSAAKTLREPLMLSSVWKRPFGHPAVVDGLKVDRMKVGLLKPSLAVWILLSIVEAIWFVPDRNQVGLLVHSLPWFLI